jgi:hypothetical protein
LLLHLRAARQRLTQITQRTPDQQSRQHQQHDREVQLVALHIQLAKARTVAPQRQRQRDGVHQQHAVQRPGKGVVQRQNQHAQAQQEQDELRRQSGTEQHQQDKCAPPAANSQPSD